MSGSPSHEQKRAFVDAFLRLLTKRAPEVARSFTEAMTTMRPTQRNVGSVYNDLLEWCRYLPAPDRREISADLEAAVGLSLDFFDQKRIERIARLVTRGVLRSDDEWRFIEERIQELCELPNRDAEIEQLNQLLAQYEDRKRARRSRRAAGGTESG